jgi:NitT/TauT family transport system permease protein
MRILETNWFPFIVTFAGILLAWQLATSVFGVPKYLIPPPASVWEVLVTHHQLLAANTLVTFRELVGGFILAVGLAVPLALLISYSRIFESFVNPLVVISQALPKIAIAPLLLVWFGFGEFPKILMAALIAFFPMLISATTGFKGIEPDVISLAKSTGASELRIFWKIRLPSALPAIFGGLKLAITFAVIGAIIGEFLSGDQGLGYLIQSASGAQRTDVLFAALIIISVVSVALFYAVEFAERRLIFWHQSQIGVVS